MPSPIFLSRPPPGFSATAVVRGMQLTFVGSYRAIQNPELPKYGYYRKAIVLIMWSLALELTLRAAFGVLRWILILCGASDSTVSNVMWALSEVLLLRQFLFMLCKDPVLMDDMFVRSLHFVDVTNLRKHPETTRLYGSIGNLKVEAKTLGTKRAPWQALAYRFAKRSAYFAAVSFLSSLPRVGRVVTPAIAFYSLQNYIGSDAALGVFVLGLLLPSYYFLVLLSVMNGSRALTNELLRPYFSRLPFSPSAKRLWLQNRQAVLIGFGLAFYLLSRVPYVGLLVYGFASAAAAYMLTKVSDPVPTNQREMNVWTEQQSLWTKPIYD